MICFMPFADLSDQWIGQLTAALGPLEMCLAADSLIPTNLRSWMEKDMIQVNFPPDVDDAKLRQAVHEFNAWADVHHKDMGDLTGFFRSGQAPPFVDETDPTQIHTQVRRYGRPSDHNMVTQIFRAALFMALAQQYDRHQAALAQELTTAQAAERDMFSRLTGEPTESDECEGPLASLGPSLNYAGALDRGLYMTRQRIQAWAAVAQGCSRTAFAFITNSRVVYDGVLDILQETEPILPWNLTAERGVRDDQVPAQSPVVETRRGVLSELAHSPDPLAISVNDDLTAGAGDALMRLELHVLAGCPPHRALARLSGLNADIDPAVPEKSSPVNTLIGLVETCADAAV